MQHLSKDHGIREPFVPHIARGLEPPRTIEEFYRFPARKGWFIDQNDYSLRVLPTLAEAPQNGASNRDLVGVKLGRFLQAWLFFGLIFTVVQKENHSLMNYDELLNGNYITTKNLRSKLDDWVAWERARPAGQRLRMIRLEAVLQFARRVVRANLKCSDTMTPPSGYSTQRNDDLYVPDTVILSIMILGETLHDVKSKIAQETKVEMRGWRNEDDSGWGPPRFVLREMRDKRLCPRTIHLLRGQLRSNATLLLAALQSARSLDSSTNSTADHSKCSASTCIVTPEADGREYLQTHCDNFCAKQYPDGQCNQSSEVTIKRIVSMMSRDWTIRPLLRFKDTNDAPSDSPELEVVEWHEEMEYATISHVWSDGFGNPKANTMLACQLKLFRDLLGKLHIKSDSATGPKLIPFWMDTLMVPVGRDYETKVVRRQSIRQIPEIYRHASHTIVLDWGLHGIDPNVQKPAQTAMRIIASGWMRRLWTLQEAFVSKSLYISQGHDAETLHYLDDLYDELDKKTEGHASNLITTVKNQLQSHVMYKQRQAASRSDTAGQRLQYSPRESAVLVVNAWKAVRWRATANELHETLALASLLDVEFKETSIEEAGLTEPVKLDKNDAAAEEARNKEKDKAMRQFWKSFDVKWPASVPPGIIFLPGERVRIPGFGWAPRTWLSAHEMDFPDPFSFIDSTAELHDPYTKSTSIASNRGLRVCFPGFLLFAEHRNILFTPNAESRVFRFPVDQGLKEWYKVEAIDGEVSTTSLGNESSEEKPLAIILSRPRPQEFPSEVGLLVQIYKRVDETIHRQTVPREIERGYRTAAEVAIDEYEELAFHCEILHRVTVSRDTMLLTGSSTRTGGPLEGEENSSVDEGGDEAESYRVPGILLPSNGDGEICIGETLGPNQIWYVDGLFNDWTEAKPSGQPPAGPDTENPIQHPKQGNSVRRMFHSRKVTKSRSKPAEESQREGVAGPSMRRGHTAGTHPEAMLANEPPTHQAGRRLNRIGTWATARINLKRRGI